MTMVARHSAMAIFEPLTFPVLKSVVGKTCALRAIEANYPRIRRKLGSHGPTVEEPAKQG
jgi:hypothetical protein